MQITTLYVCADDHTIVCVVLSEYDCGIDLMLQISTSFHIFKWMFDLTQRRRMRETGR